VGVWERRYYRVLNAVMRALLRSPAHRLWSHRVLLLEFRGRRSGRRYRMPVSYWERGPMTVVCLTSSTWSRWWRNLDGAPVVVWLRGARRNGRAELVADQRLKVELVSGFLSHNVHDAHHYGVVLDDTGKPAEASLAALAESLETKVITVSLGPFRPPG
jgi:hypothetical protein